MTITILLYYYMHLLSAYTHITLNTIKYYTNEIEHAQAKKLVDRLH